MKKQSFKKRYVLGMGYPDIDNYFVGLYRVVGDHVYDMKIKIPQCPDPIENKQKYRLVLERVGKEAKP